ncbi:Uncharacterised protein [[Clostridium] sordellii]|uniref:hypothetical protein n=1 Tax=Paraclostridium sordellii TaxID=1505 RepID=UPI0005E83523|nr:hypothetical protein [Paeniclostridium sordellii]CEP45536.1 Uncharacterised protein [[Clostridium] sordellii] [Paeniclostridium sordellii]
MPNIAKGRMLTFSKKNQDVQKIIENELKTGIKFPDYVCKAVRFYEKYKEYDFNSNPKVPNLDNIDNLVETKVIEILQNKNILDLIQSNPKLTIAEKNRQLEENLDYVDIDED